MKFVSNTNVLRNTAFIACLTFIFSSCSGVRYGYISRVNDKNTDKTEVIKEEAVAVVEEPAVVLEETSLNSFVEVNEEAVIADNKTRTHKDCKVQNNASNGSIEVKKMKPLAMLKEMKKMDAAVKSNPDSVKESHEVSGYFRTGLILVLIGAILLFFPSPISIIGYIIMLVGVVFVVLGLIDML